MEKKGDFVARLQCLTSLNLLQPLVLRHQYRKSWEMIQMTCLQLKGSVSFSNLYLFVMSYFMRSVYDHGNILSLGQRNFSATTLPLVKLRV